MVIWSEQGAVTTIPRRAIRSARNNSHSVQARFSLMQSDEREIRQLVFDWIAATKAGDVEKVLSLMSEDVVFLVPSRPVMRKADFAVAARAQASSSAPQFDGTSDIQEIQVFGDWAFMWTKLTVVMTPPGQEPMKRSGYTLSVLKKEQGRWVLARDANMLAPQSGS